MRDRKSCPALNSISRDVATCRSNAHRGGNLPRRILASASFASSQQSPRRRRLDSPSPMHKPASDAIPGHVNLLAVRVDVRRIAIHHPTRDVTQRDAPCRSDSRIIRAFATDDVPSCSQFIRHAMTCTLRYPKKYSLHK